MASAAAIVSSLVTVVSGTQVQTLEPGIYLVRHALSIANEKKITQGIGLEWPLSPDGHAQATQLGQLLSAKIAQGQDVVIVSSTARRAQETAIHIFNQLSQAGINVTRRDDDARLCEIGKGEREGTVRHNPAFDEERSKRKGLSAYEKFTIPKGAGCGTHKEASEEMEKAIKSVENRGGITLIVTHGEAMKAFTMEANVGIEQLSREPGTEPPKVTDKIKNCDALEIKDGKVVRHIRFLDLD